MHLVETLMQSNGMRGNWKNLLLSNTHQSLENTQPFCPTMSLLKTPSKEISYIHRLTPGCLSQLYL